MGHKDVNVSPFLLEGMTHTAEDRGPNQQIVEMNKNPRLASQISEEVVKDFDPDSQSEDGPFNKKGITAKKASKTKALSSSFHLHELGDQLPLNSNETFDKRGEGDLECQTNGSPLKNPKNLPQICHTVNDNIENLYSQMHYRDQFRAGPIGKNKNLRFAAEGRVTEECKALSIESI